MFIVGICIVILFPPHYHFAALLLWSTFSLFTYTWRGRPSRHVRPPRLSEQESRCEIAKRNGRLERVRFLLIFQLISKIKCL